MNSEKMQCNQSKCMYNEKIDEMQNKISALTICDAVNKTNIQNIKGEIDTMNKELEKLWEKIECKFDKVTSANNKLVWFTMTSAVGMLGNLLMNLLG